MSRQKPQPSDAQPMNASANAPANPPSPTSAPTLGLDDAQLSAALHDDGPPVAASVGRQGDEGRPYCPRHNVLMRAAGTKGDVTHYACPVENCRETEKRARPRLRVPTEPMRCPTVRCQPRKGEPPALEVDARRSNVAQLQMVCPRCGYGLAVPRPQFDEQAAREYRRQVAEAAASDLATR